MVIAVLMAVPGISRFVISCDALGKWTIEYWLFCSVMHVLDWASFITLASLMVYACYQVLERIGDWHWRRTLAEDEIVERKRLSVIVRWPR